MTDAKADQFLSLSLWLSCCNLGLFFISICYDSVRYYAIMETHSVLLETVHYYAILETHSVRYYAVLETLCGTTRYWRLTMCVTTRYWRLTLSATTRYWRLCAVLRDTGDSLCALLRGTGDCALLRDTRDSLCALLNDTGDCLCATTRYWRLCLCVLHGTEDSLCSTTRYWRLSLCATSRYWRLSLYVYLVLRVVFLFPAVVKRVAFRQSLVCRCGRSGNVVCPRSALSTPRRPAYVSRNLSVYRQFGIARNFHKFERLHMAAKHFKRTFLHLHSFTACLTLRTVQGFCCGVADCATICYCMWKLTFSL
jgi:hypothetical protein